MTCPSCGGPVVKQRGNIEEPVFTKRYRLERVVRMGSWLACLACEWIEELR